MLISLFSLKFDLFIYCEFCSVIAAGEKKHIQAREKKNLDFKSKDATVKSCFP